MRPQSSDTFGGVSQAANEEPVVKVSEDRDGAILELDASEWSADGLAMTLRSILDQSPQGVSIWIDHPSDETNNSLARLGFQIQRDLFRMERPLPMEQRTDIETRSFIVDKDEEEWCCVNNRAFAWHREQSGWTPELVRERQTESWFDPSGFLIHQRDGRIAAFCWTKIHSEETPLVGEVYVIAVDPDFHGLGLGRALTLAGYQHLEGAGVTQGMLYVDADNTPAVTLYRDIGLEVQVVRRLYQR